MTDRPDERVRRLAQGLACFALVAVLAVLVRLSWSPLLATDRAAGRAPQRFTYDHHSVVVLWTWVARLFDVPAMSVYTVVAVALLALRHYRRAALWTAGVMIAVGVGNTLVKLLVGRHRPVFRHPVEVLHSYSFPSGHSSGIAAAAGVTVVLTVMLVRRRAVRRLLVTAAVFLALLVGADRIFLGVHDLSDVLGGYLLGVGVVLVGLAVFDPRPRSIAEVHGPLPDTVPPPDRLLGVVLNPAKIEDPGQFRSMVEAMAAETGWEGVEWWQTTPEDTGHGMAHAAAVRGAACVIAVGGDGTVRAVCEELAGTGIPVGIVPAGTGNLLARNLGIPLYLRAAVDVALNGQDRAIDMVSVTGDKMPDGVFLVMAGMGFDAAIMQGVNEDVKARVGWLAYVWSALKSLMFPAIRVEVSVDDGPFTRHRARTIVVGNVGHLQAGMPLLPDAAIDDGTLDVVLLYPRRFLSWLPLALRVLSKDRRTDELITRMTGRSVVVRASVDAPRQLDGDLAAPGRELRCSCVHGRLLVRVPR
ncbi:MAG TPA: diacylglycerol kinase family protein [Marmoricola sp.]|nr:diacylglycerol kinase family protein [Marmoricola sp.]